MGILVFVFEILGTVAFSVSGALVALEKKMDLLGVLMLGLTTATGGGIIRDILLGDTPPKAFLDPTLPLVSVLTSLIVFFFAAKKIAEKHHDRNRALLLFMDSVGLGIFTVVGVEASQSLYESNFLLHVFMGVLTGVGGGVMRDLFSCRIPLIFTKHFYATASLIGAVAYIVLATVFNPLVGGIAAVVGVVLLRMFASRYLWSLPKVK